MPADIVFETHPNMLRLAKHGPVKYWLDNVFVEGDTQEVTMTACIGTHRRRLGRWPHVSEHANDTLARKLISEHHDSLLELSTAGASS